MNAWHTARGIEAQAMTILLPYLQEQSDGRVVLTNKGTLSKWLQESVGDAVMTVSDDDSKEEVFMAVEIKAEAKHTGNVFLEIWSNRNLESRASHAERGQNPGWMFKLRSDRLLYYFIDKDILYSFDLFSLKRWLFGRGDDFGRWGSGSLRERMQRRYLQMNDTCGVLAPLAQLHEELPPKAMLFTNVRQRELEHKRKASA